MPKSKKVSVSELKAHALQIVETVKTKKIEVEVFKRGKLVARIVPVADEVPNLLGLMRGACEYVGDEDSIFEPVDVKWHALGET